MFRALAQAIQHDLTIIHQAREQRWVMDPLVASTPVGNPEEWMARRRIVLTSPRRVAELDTAGDAARELREAFEDLVRGKLNLRRVNSLLTDLEGLLAITEAIHRPGEKP